MTRFRTLLGIALFGAGMTISTLCSAHSAAYTDNFVFDDSNEGQLPLVGKLRELSRQASTCTNGLAGVYPCRNVDLESLTAPGSLGGGNSQLNDIWGWTDLSNGKEIAIVGRNNGTSFVDVSDSKNPVLLGFLPSHNNGQDSWRDIKVYQDHAFIVADGNGNSSHGLQVYDLRQLASVTPGATLSETAHHNGFGPAHNIAINEDSGFAYIVGANQCSGGLYMMNVATPASPTFAGCFSGDGYTHDTQCVIYKGPDARYFNREICVAYNEDTLTIVDVTNKSNPSQLSRTPYTGAQYTHQGWFLDGNHTYLILNDEGDETGAGVNTTSYIFDVSLLDAPKSIGNYVGPTKAIDHNLYTKDGLVYESNYRAGLRVLGSAGIASGILNELAYFDTIPCSNTAQFSGAWSNYIDFASGNIVVSDIAKGLFVLKPNQSAIAANANSGIVATSPSCNTAPVANAGADLNVNTGVNVSLNGGASSDPNGDSLNYAWVETSSAGVTLTNANTATPSFTAPATAMTLTFQLTVSDNAGATATDTVNVTVNAPPAGNSSPISDAGADQSVNTGVNVSLNGANSRDPDGDPITYAWAETSASGITLSNANTATPSFTAPSSATTVTLQLTVTDNKGAAGTDTVDVVVSTPPAGNATPLANAGPDQSVNVGASVNLNGANSSDPDGDPITYAWSEMTTTGVTLNYANTATPTFTAPTTATTVTLRLTATDNKGAAGTDTVTIAVNVASSDGGSGSGGGGSVYQPLLLLPLALLAFLYRRRSRT